MGREEWSQERECGGREEIGVVGKRVSLDSTANFEPCVALVA